MVDVHCVCSGKRAARAPSCTQPHWRRQWRQPLRRPTIRCHAAQQQPSRVVLYDAYDRQIPYEQARQWQRDMVDIVAARVGSGDSSSTGNEDASSGSGDSSSSSSDSSGQPPLGALLLLQHPPVYTLGAGATEGHLKFDPEAPPLPLYRTERGGEVTYHGPGQLVMYPILDLRRPPLQPDLHWYLRTLEEVVIRALDAVSGLRGERIPGLTGVWVDGEKVAALGVRASRWVTYHGLALNVVNDLSPFRQIVPCGIADRQVASVEGLLARQAQQQVMPAQQLPAQQAQQARQALLEEYRFALLDSFEEVFGVQLSPAGSDTAGSVTAGMAARLAAMVESSTVMAEDSSVMEERSSAAEESSGAAADSIAMAESSGPAASAGGQGGSGGGGASAPAGSLSKAAA